jgi:hypothetical protein
MELALLYQCSGLKSRALAMFRRVLEVQPDHEQALAMAAELEPLRRPTRASSEAVRAQVGGGIANNDGHEESVGRLPGRGGGGGTGSGCPWPKCSC